MYTSRDRISQVWCRDATATGDVYQFSLYLSIDSFCIHVPFWPVLSAQRISLIGDLILSYVHMYIATFVKCVFYERHENTSKTWRSICHNHYTRKQVKDFIYYNLMFISTTISRWRNEYPQRIFIFDEYPQWIFIFDRWLHGVPGLLRQSYQHDYCSAWSQEWPRWSGFLC